MPIRLRFLSLCAASIVGATALLATTTAVAADNSGIVIIDQQQRSTPFGSYNSRRQTQVFGPSSGFRYEEYRTPVQPVYPRYRNPGYRHGRSDRHDGGYAYGPSYRGDHREGRVIQRYGPGAYGRYGAPAAPRYNGYGHSRGHRDRFGGHDRGYGHDRDRPRNGRAIDRPQRAIKPAQRAIGSDRR